MKILVVTQYFAPEPGATTNRLLSFVEAFAKRGHEVTVICEFPNHPRGILNPKDKWRLFRKEDNGSYKIIRTFVLTFAKKNNIKRMLFYLSFAFSSFMAGLFIKRHDIVFASSPPIFYVIGALIVALIKRSKFVLDIRDLWPDAVVDIDAMSNGPFIKTASWVERKLYKKALTIFATATGAKDKIELRGGAGKTQVIYNGSYESILNWNGDRDKFRKNQGWDGKTVILYAGLIGLAQGLSDLVPHLKILDDDIIFQIIGNGPLIDELETLVKRNSLKNVRFKDMIPLDELIPFLHSADMLLVLLKETSLFETTIPSKFFDYMAAGRPIITNVDGEVRHIMEQRNTGKYFSIKKHNSFGDVVNSLASDPALRQTMGENGKNLVRENYLRSKLSETVANKMEIFSDKKQNDL